MGGTIDREKATEELATRELLDVASLGGKVRLARQSRMTFTVEKAHWLLGCKEFIGDRDLRDAHVAYLAKCMKQGTFRAELVQLAVCQVGKEVFRINGQHTAWARDIAGDEWKTDERGAQVNLLEYEADDEDALRTLYATFDRAAPRTKAHVIGSHLHGTSEFVDVKAPVLEKLPAGLAFWLWEGGNERAKHDGDEIAAKMKTEFTELVVRIGKFLGRWPLSSNRHLFRGPVIAAMFGTFNTSAGKAKEFWTTVADGTGVTSPKDPRNMLRTFLLTAAIGAGGKGSSGKKKVSQEVMYRRAIAAWNAWREDREVDYLRGIDSGPRPVVVK